MELLSKAIVNRILQRRYKLIYSLLADVYFLRQQY